MPTPSGIKERIKEIFTNTENVEKLKDKSEVSFYVKDNADTFHKINAIKIMNGWKVLTISPAKVPIEEDEFLEAELKRSMDAFIENSLQTLMNYIYAEQTVPPFRELLQNAVDAHIDRQAEDEDYIPRIDFVLETKFVNFKNIEKERLSTAMVVDNGIGMDLITIKKDLLIPTISSKRQDLLLKPSMAITKKVVKKMGVFGVGFFAFLGIMKKVCILTRKKDGPYYFVYLDVPRFFKTILNPNYEEMILEVPATITTKTQLTDFLREKNVPGVRRTLYLDLFKKFSRYKIGTLIYGMDANYEVKDVALRKTEEMIKIINWMGNFVLIRYPKIKITINGDPITIDNEINEFMTQGLVKKIKKTQIITTEADDIIHLEREIIVYALPKYGGKAPIQVLQGILPISIGIVHYSDDKEETEGGLKAITAMALSYYIEDIEYHFTIRGGLDYSYIISCDWIDLNIGRDKIIENESYETFKEMVARAILEVNNEFLPSSQHKDLESRGVLTVRDIYNRYEAYYFYNSIILKNNRFNELLQSLEKEPLFDLIFPVSIAGQIIKNVSIRTVLKYKNIYLMYIEPVKEISIMLKNMIEKGAAIAISTYDGIFPFIVLNEYIKEILKNDIKVYYLYREQSRYQLPHWLLLNIIETANIDYTEYVHHAQQPERIIEKDDKINYTSADRRVVRAAFEITNHLYREFKNLFIETEKHIAALRLAGDLLKDKPNFNFTPEEERTLYQFFQLKEIEVRLIHLSKKTIAIWYDMREELGKVIDPFVGINKKSELYPDMLNLIDNRLEMLAYLSSLIAHEFAHATAIKILSKYILNEQSPEHYTSHYVNARELTQHLAGEYVTRQIHAELRAEEKEPFEAYCKECGKGPMSYIGDMKWKCKECDRLTEPPKVFFMKHYLKRAHRILYKK